MKTAYFVFALNWKWLNKLTGHFKKSGLLEFQE